MADKGIVRTVPRKIIVENLVGTDGAHVAHASRVTTIR
jgi:hypothetical protein